MRLHHQFDLNLGTVNVLRRDFFSLPPFVIEELVTTLAKKGYTVIKSSSDYLGIPKSIIVAKEFTGPFVSHFSNKIREDFSTVTGKLGIEKLFE